MSERHSSLTDFQKERVLASLRSASFDLEDEDLDVELDLCPEGASDWSSVEEVRRMSVLRRRLLGGTWTLRMSGGLRGQLAAATRDLVKGQTEDGMLQWGLKEDPATGDLTVYLGSFDLALAGRRVVVKIGDCRTETVFRRVAPDQVGEQVIVAGEVRKKMPADLPVEVIVMPLAV
jgi:hypothetical protein